MCHIIFCDVNFQGELEADAVSIHSGEKRGDRSNGPMSLAWREEKTNRMLCKIAHDLQ